MIYPEARTIEALSRHAWRCVAKRVSNGRRADREEWDWLLPTTDRNALLMAQAAGHATTGQYRNADGQFELLARLTKR